MDVYQSVNMVKHVYSDHTRQALSEVAVWISGKDLMQVRASVLFRRLSAEDHDSERICHRNGGYAARERLDVDGTEQLTHRHQRHRLVAMDGRKNSKRGTTPLPGDQLEAKLKVEAGHKSGHVELDLLAPRIVHFCQRRSRMLH